MCPFPTPPIEWGSSRWFYCLSVTTIRSIVQQITKGNCSLSPFTSWCCTFQSDLSFCRRDQNVSHNVNTASINVISHYRSVYSIGLGSWFLNGSNLQEGVQGSRRQRPSVQQIVQIGCKWQVFIRNGNFNAIVPVQNPIFRMHIWTRVSMTLSSFRQALIHIGAWLRLSMVADRFATCVSR